jgi:antitoxin component of MazEF toxin-antitoxin module
MELLKKEAKMGKWGTSIALRIPKPVLEVLDFHNDDVEMTVQLNDDGTRSLLVTEKPIVEEPAENYSDDEMKWIGLMLDQADEDVALGRVYSYEEALQWLGGEENAK